MRHQIPMIAITGGPCGGKSTFLVRVRAMLEKFGYHPFIVTETATELMRAGASYTEVGWELFQKELLLYTLSREDHYREIAWGMKDKKKVVVICDRGVLDAKAYMGDFAYDELIEREGYNESELVHRYDLVVHLVTAANGAEAFYTLDNNEVRTESAAQARELDQKILHAWLGHPHHEIIDNTTDFAGKMHRALCAFARKLNMPEPLEIERKFLLKNFRQDMIPANAAAIEITQDYLVNNDFGNRRVRKSVRSGHASYTYTEKLPTGERGTCIERERAINHDEYALYLRSRDTALYTIHKTRYKFEFGNKIFELDVYRDRLAPLVVLEVELRHIDEPVTFPPTWDLQEVTDDPTYKNYALAKALPQ